VPQGSVLGPLLYIIFTSDLPISPGVTVATFADDTALLAIHEDPVTAFNMVQANLDELAVWLNNNKLKVNETKSTHVKFTFKRAICPTFFNNIQLPQADAVKYSGMHLERQITRHTHICNKRQHLHFKINKMYWLFSYKSHLSTEKKLLLYKIILNPVWTPTSKFYNVSSQEFYPKYSVLLATLQMIQTLIHNDTHMPKVKEEITKFSMKSRKIRKPSKFSCFESSEQQSTHISRNTILDFSSKFTQ
jgi:hypothetical protein